jgi:D-alanine-D-alanine ligase
MIRVGVIRGGISSEYEVSINTGGNVLSHLRGDKLNNKYKTVDILIDKEGAWHVNGRPTSMENVSNSVDVIFNALHGDYGEDGKVQQVLEQWHIPYTGSGPFASALGFNKALTKEQFIRLGIKTPKHVLYPAYRNSFDGSVREYAESLAKNVWNQFPAPWVVKKVSSGSSVGVYICKIYPELVSALEKCALDNTDVLVEEMIEGKEATVPVIEKFRNQDIYVLPPIEIRVPKGKAFFDYEVKYGESSADAEIVPGNFSREEKDELIRLAALIHTGLNLDHYSRSDFMIHPKKGIYALEVNTLPGLSDASLTPKALAAVGATMPEFIHHILTLALDRNKF